MDMGNIVGWVVINEQNWHELLYGREVVKLDGMLRNELPTAMEQTDIVTQDTVINDRSRN